MTFDTWWKEQGSLHPDICSLPFETREVFKRIAQTAWTAAEEQDSSFTSYKTLQAEEQAKLKNLKKQVRKFRKTL